MEQEMFSAAGIGGKGWHFIKPGEGGGWGARWAELVTSKAA